MRPLILGTFSVFILLTLLSTVMILLNRGQSQPDIFNYLRLCEGQPCYLNVVPGKTNWDAALTTLEDMHGIQFDPDTNIASNPPGFQGSAIIFDAGQGTTQVGGFDLDIRSPDIRVGSLVLRFGTPCAVALQIMPNTEILKYASGLWVVVFLSELDEGFLKPFTVVDEIDVFHNVSSCDPLPSNPGDQLWRGFARYTN